MGRRLDVDGIRRWGRALSARKAREQKRTRSRQRWYPELREAAFTPGVPSPVPLPPTLALVLRLNPGREALTTAHRCIPDPCSADVLPQFSNSELSSTHASLRIPLTAL
jgi:hypothetical protein